MPTLRDVAELAEVSTSTVSRVLSGDTGLSVSKDTRERIFRAAEQIHYQAPRRYKPKSRQPKPQDYKLCIVGFVNEEYEAMDPYFASIRHGVERECRMLGIAQSTSIYWSDSSSIYSVVDGSDGVIIIGENSEAGDYFYNRSTKVVFVDKCPDRNRFDSVVVDFERGTKLAIDHLIQLGHRNIGYLGGDSVNGEPRLSTFRSYMRDKEIYNAKHELICGWSTIDGYECAKAAIMSGNFPSALIVSSDPIAIGVMRAATEAGIRIPDDLAIASFDDMSVSAYLTPPLTTVRIPTEEMGRVAVQLLLHDLATGSLPVTVVLPVELVVRESCGAKNFSTKR